MQTGFNNKEEIPLSYSFCKQFLSEIIEDQIENKIENKILTHLDKHPMAVGDLIEARLFNSERTARRALERLEDKRLIKREHSRPGLRQEYSLLEKGSLLLKRRK